MLNRSLLSDFNQLVNNERAKWLALLIKKMGDIQLAEDCLQESLLKAFESWQQLSKTQNPQSWIITTAYNQAIDSIRRQTNFRKKQPTLKFLNESRKQFDSIQEDNSISDERLKLIFTCCHPALDKNSQIALTLNTICGLSVGEIADSFIVSKVTMAQRLVRVKKKIKLSKIPYCIPANSEMNQRLDAVLSVIYLIYNRGYSKTTDLIHHQEDSNEAFYLIKILNQQIPNQAEVLGLMSLMYFHQSRIKARSHQQNKVITLEKQNRQLWNHELIEKANQTFIQAMSLNSMGAYQIQAAISGVHSQAKDFKDTDWKQIIGLYKKLYQYLPTETVVINYAVALCYNHQAQLALKKIEEIDSNKLKEYQPYYLAKAHILKSLNQKKEAINNLSLAMALAKNKNQTAFFQSQIELIND